MGVLQGFRVVLGILLALSRGKGIDLLEIGDRKGRLLGILPGKAVIKVRKVRLPVFQLRDHKAHLQTPVAEVDVADRGVAVIADDPLDGLADDGTP